MLPSLVNVRSVPGFHRRIWVPEVLTFTKLSPDFHTCAVGAPRVCPVYECTHLHEHIQQTSKYNKNYEK